MAKWLSRKRRFCDRIPDWIWPHLKGDAEPDPQNRDYFSVKHAHLLDKVDRILTSSLAQVEERRQNVESKLMSLFALTSVLSAVVIAGLAAFSMLGAVKEASRIFVWGAMLLVFYVVLHLLCLLWATASGLKRKSYKQLSPADIVPQDGETPNAYQVRLLNLQANSLRWNEWVTNQKVSEMAVAHIALKNVLTAISIFIVLAGLNSLRVIVNSLSLCAGAAD